MVIPSWLQEIHDKTDKKPRLPITDEEVLKLAGWIEQENYSEEDGYLLFDLRLANHELPLKWENYYKRFIEKFKNPSALAKFHRLASFMYADETKLAEAEEAATQAFLLDRTNYDNLLNYIIRASALSIETKIELIEQSLVLEPHSLQAKFNAAILLYKLSPISEFLAQKLRARVLELCDEAINSFHDAKTHHAMRNIYKLRNIVINNSTR